MPLKSSKRRQSSPFSPLPCSFCLSSRAGHSLTSQPVHNLLQKYYQPQLESYHYRTTHRILLDEFSGGSTNMRETELMSEDKERVDRCYRFGEIVELISGVVRHRVDRDRYGLVHFHGILYQTTKRYESNVRRLNTKKKQLTNKNQQSLGIPQEQPLLKLHLQRRVLKDLGSFWEAKDHNATNSSTVDLRLLTNNIDGMIKKISNLSIIRGVVSKGKKKSEKKEGKRPTLQQFQGISVIKNHNEGDKEKDKNHGKQQQESYGLERVKSKRLHHKLKQMSVKSIDHFTIASPLSIPQTPKKYLQPPQGHFSHSNKSLKSLSMRSKDLSNTLNSSPASPSIHKSVTLGLSQSLSGKARVGRKKR